MPRKGLRLQAKRCPRGTKADSGHSADLVVVPSVSAGSASGFAITDTNAIFAFPAKHETARKLLSLLKFGLCESNLSLYRVAERAGFEPAGVLTSEGVPPVDSQSTALSQTRPPLRYSRFGSPFLASPFQSKRIRCRSFPVPALLNKAGKVADECLLVDFLAVLASDPVDHPVDVQRLTACGVHRFGGQADGTFLTLSASTGPSRTRASNNAGGRMIRRWGRLGAGRLRIG